MTALAAYEAGLRGGGCWVRTPGGGREPLPLTRWLRPADDADHEFLAGCTGPTLDVGCGPGRLTIALTERSVPALGIDVAPEAVRLTRARGAQALLRDVFADVPGAGRWAHVLLADGNIGIGGDPVALLRRIAALLGPGGTVHVDLDPPGTGITHTRLHLVADGVRGGMLPWARVGTDGVVAAAAGAGLVVSSCGRRDGRWVAVLGRAA